MGTKRFHTRRHWHNTLLVLWSAPLPLLLAVLIFAAYGSLAVLLAVGALTVLALAVALSRDAQNRCTYLLRDDRLEVHGKKGPVSIDVGQVIDASLVDRAAARDYIRARLDALGITGRERKRRMRAYVAYCTVDIGLTSFTLGIGRGVIDRMPNARNDLVLLRMRDGQDVLLSPQYNQEFVAAINRAVHAVPMDAR
jgi:hypothetical protein